MAVYVVTGKLGGGKTLCSVGRIRDKLRAGCMIATNLDLDLVAMLGPWHRSSRVIRVPDKPSRADLDAIGCGNESYDEERNGLLVLDECGTWFNARNWQDKTRQDVNAWFLHARKRGWDVFLIVQDLALLDSQARDALAEMVVYCRRLDRLAVPVLGTLFKAFTGSRLPLPRVHMARVCYGTEHNAMLNDRWSYRGNDLFACYDTRQSFLVSYPHGAHSLLPPWLVKGRYMVSRDSRFYMRMTRIFMKRWEKPVALATGLLVGVAFVGALAFGKTYSDYARDRSVDFRAAVQSAAVDVMLEQHAAASALKISETKVIDEKAEDLPKVDALSIVAWIGRGEQSEYLLGARGGRAVSTQDMRAAGYTVIPRGRCAVVVVRDGKSHTITCIADAITL